MGYLRCTGDDNCPACNILGPPRKLYHVSAYDKKSGRSVVIEMSEKQYRELMNPKSLPWWKRLWQRLRGLFKKV